MADVEIIGIERIGLVVRDLDAACGFYEALGFLRTKREHRAGLAFAALNGLDEGASADTVAMRLGAQEIELLAFTPAGLAYPAERSAADPLFQHFAIVVADMDAAYAALEAQAGWTPISSGGPQLLPPATGSITAFKFRDPDGHPLEFSRFPPAVAGPAWSDPPPGRVFLGIDHSALAVADMAASLDFYVGEFGLRLVARQWNSGPAQDRLDGLSDVEVDIAVLKAGREGPHIELLAYRGGPATAPRAVATNDVAATRLVMRAASFDRLAISKGPWMVSDGAVAHGDERQAILLRDPDGHSIQVNQH